MAITPGAARALGSPLPKLTAVNGLDELGSISLITFANQPYVATAFGSQVCQISIALKWDLEEFS